MWLILETVKDKIETKIKDGNIKKGPVDISLITLAPSFSLSESSPKALTKNKS